MEGDCVTLNSELTDTQIVENIVWRFNNSRIATGIKNIQYDNDERFKDRLKLDQTGSLTISDIRTTDCGLYKLRIFISNEEFIRKFNVTVNVPDSHPPSYPTSHPHPPPPVSVSHIVLISSAVGSLMIVAVIMIFCMCRKHKDKGRSGHMARGSWERSTHWRQCLIEENWHWLVTSGFWTGCSNASLSMRGRSGSSAE
ncbi:hypothetical protein F2P79_023417 [Pimephales promelas]|nr:hypothetical protein F2P79_023417 [Pimephales promelas]